MKLERKIEYQVSDVIRGLAEKAGQDSPYHIPPEFIASLSMLIVNECIDQIISSQTTPSHYAIEIALRVYSHFLDLEEEI